jgi:hypothetical protein
LAYLEGFGLSYAKFERSFINEKVTFRNPEYQPEKGGSPKFIIILRRKKNDQ